MLLKFMHAKTFAARRAVAFALQRAVLVRQRYYRTPCEWALRLRFNDVAYSQSYEIPTWGELSEVFVCFTFTIRGVFYVVN